MSRTYRRKKLPVPSWVLINYTWQYRSLSHCYKEHIDKDSVEGKELTAKYYSDAQMTMKQVPKWYKVYFCRRPFRRKEKVAVIQAVKYPEDDVVFPKPVKDAMYYW